MCEWVQRRSWRIVWPPSIKHSGKFCAQRQSHTWSALSWAWNKTLLTLLAIEISVYKCSLCLDSLERRAAGKPCDSAGSQSCSATLLAVVRLFTSTYLINYRHCLAKQLTCLLLQVKINFSFESGRTEGSQCVGQQIGMDTTRQLGNLHFGSPNKDSFPHHPFLANIHKLS